MLPRSAFVQPISGCRDERKKIAENSSNSTQLLLTKGDNNKVDDLVMYNGLQWLERKHIIGKVRG